MDGQVNNLLESTGQLEASSDPRRLQSLLAARDLLDALICASVTRVDQADAVAADGAVSTVSWLSTQAGCSRREAAALMRRSVRLRTCPQTMTAWHAGGLTSAQVDAIVANVSERTAALFAEHEAAVVPTLVGLSVAHTTTAMRRWAALADAVIAAPDPAPIERSLHLSPTLDGRGELTGSLDPDAFAAVAAALVAAATPNIEGEPARAPARRRADALVALCRFYLDRGDGDVGVSGGRHRPHVNVVVTMDELERGTAARTPDGRPVEAPGVAALACDARIHRFVTDGRSRVLDAGRTTRTINPTLFTALALRDQGCRFPHCDRPVSWCEAYHVVAWQHGGPTDQDNLVLLCWRHHHDFAHRPGWHLKLLPDASVEITTPTGTTMSGRPPPPIGGSGLTACFQRLRFERDP